MNAHRIKVKKEGWEKNEQGKKERMDIVSSTGSGRARIFIVTSLNRSSSVASRRRRNNWTTFWSNMNIQKSLNLL